MTNNHKKVKRKERTIEEEEALNELADIFIEALLYELKEEQGLGDNDTISIKLTD